MEILKALFTSRTRVKLLTIFMQNPDGEFFIRELTRILDEQINSVRRELDSLRKTGLLRSRTKNRKKFYTVNKNFILFNELHSMIMKSLSSKEGLVKKIGKLGDIEFLLLSGAFLGRNSNCDLLLVGKVNKSELEKLLDEEGDTKEPIKFSIMSKEDFLYRIKCNDKFIKDLVQDSTNIVGINKLAKHIESVE
ncbi:MAG: winged helix-turn-helix domain-containing protein [Candidatus Peregrinibacteria bacterium]|nr:winged helix-turn-helix domain-containing protein [Candidatus Peregrinibacteria bacterium]MDZ4245318.1 winged helix-turn-helix domain-containing protein [Candidatus Gracilibacteria bacterium]